MHSEFVDFSRSEAADHISPRKLNRSPKDDHRSDTSRLSQKMRRLRTKRSHRQFRRESIGSIPPYVTPKLHHSRALWYRPPSTNAPFKISTRLVISSRTSAGKPSDEPVEKIECRRWVHLAAVDIVQCETRVYGVFPKNKYNAADFATPSGNL
jgi:hypothetical protein